MKFGYLVAGLALFAAACDDKSEALDHDDLGLPDLSVDDDLATFQADLTPPPDPGPAPPLRLTVNALPDSMNGTIGYSDLDGPHEFVLRLPNGGFTIDYYVEGGASDGGGAFEPASFAGGVTLTASVPLVINGATIAAGQNLVPQLTCTANADTQAWPDEARFVRSCTLPAGIVASSGSTTTTVTWTGALLGSEQTTTTDTITVELAAMPPSLDPFASEDRWLVTLSRDLFSHALSKESDGSFTVTATYLPDGNGKADLDEAMELLGLASSNSAVSAAFKADFLARVRNEAHRIFGLDATGAPTANGARIRLFFEGDTGAPDATDWSVDADFSVIALGGDPDAVGIANNYVGRAHVDPNNQANENDATYGFGIFTTAMVRQILSNSLGALLVKEFSPLDGLPLGTYADDDKIVDPNYTPPQGADQRHRLRWNQLKTIRAYLPMAVASTLCHEMGHSLGLVKDGPPPIGLFGGIEGLSFTKTFAGSWHIDTPGLNVMQTGRVTDYAEVLAGQSPRFNQLEMAYLRRRLIVGELP